MTKFFSFLSALVLLTSCSDTKTSKPIGVPSYQTIHHLTLPGTFFHFNYQGKIYLACSIHQGGSAPATQLLREGKEGSVVVGETVHRQKDLLVLEFDPKTLSSSDALPYLKIPTSRSATAFTSSTRRKKS